MIMTYKQDGSETFWGIQGRYFGVEFLARALVLYTTMNLCISCERYIMKIIFGAKIRGANSHILVHKDMHRR